MKNILLLAALAVGLAACTSVEDNPSSVVDNGKWTVDPGAIDLSVQPGDNFYQYAVGSILKKNKITTTGEPDMKGYLDYVVKSIHDSRCDALDRPSLNVLTKHVSDMNATSKQAQQLLAAQCARINAATTLEEAWQLTGQLIAEGSATPCSFSALNMNGRINFYIDVPVSAIENISSSVRSTEKLDNPDFIRSLRPLVGPTRRAINPADWPMIIAWCKGYGIDPTNVYMIDEVAMKVGGTSRNPNLTKFLDILKKVQTSDLKVYKETICDLIMDDTCFVSEQYFESAKKPYQDKLSSVSYSKLTLKNLPGLIYNSLGAYENSKVFCDRYVTDEIVANVTARCQEIKNTFAQRIQRNTWMSEASKTNALDKLNAITINAGKPDSWYSEGLTDIASNTCLLQDVMQLRKTKANLYKALCNKPTKEAGMHIMASENRGLTVLNAFYHQNYIGIYIMPVFCLPPLYDITANEAEQYALATVFGHEFTHGFDSSGANFSKDGLYGPIWGTETDKKKFEELGKQYADYFSTLLVMPDELPGIYCDGTYTLTENIADLGGIAITFEAYNNRLKSQGFTGSELVKQQRRFFLAYCRNWWSAYNKELALMRTVGEGPMHLGKDVHALNKERVNGPLPNIDEWYGLFRVNTSNKLYLAPDKRTYIW